MSYLDTRLKDIYYGTETNSNAIQHFGILGMKWGIRKYQNPDGTLTNEGKKRYKKPNIFIRGGRFIKAKIDEMSKVNKYNMLREKLDKRLDLVADMYGSSSKAYKNALKNYREELNVLNDKTINSILYGHKKAKTKSSPKTNTSKILDRDYNLYKSNKRLSEFLNKFNEIQKEAEYDKYRKYYNKYNK